MDNQITKFYPLLVLVFILSLISVGVSAVTLCTIISEKEEESSGTKEDYVTIAEQYEILPTTKISDAYKSGSTDGLSDKDRETLDMATAVVNDVIKDGMSDYEKEKAIFDWVIATLGQDRGLLTVIPSSGSDSDNPYGVLKYHNAVCVGYATTFRLFMEMLDIPCKVIHESGMYHSWNLVQLNNNWYHVDCYSAVGDGSYRYFNMPDALVGQSWDREFFPTADSFEYNPSYMASQKITDIYELPNIVKSAIENKDPMVSVLFNKTLTEHDAQVGISLMDSIQELFWATPEYSEIYFDRNYYPTPDGYILIISISGNSESEESLTEEEKQAISDKVNEVFGDFVNGDAENPEELGETPEEEITEDATPMDETTNEDITEEISENEDTKDNNE